MNVIDTAKTVIGIAQLFWINTADSWALIGRFGDAAAHHIVDTSLSVAFKHARVRPNQPRPKHMHTYVPVGIFPSKNKYLRSEISDSPFSSVVLSRRGPGRK